MTLRGSNTFSRYSESSMRTLLEAIPDLVWLKNSDGVYLACNHRFENFFGATEAEIVGRTDYDFVSKALADSFRDNDRIAMQRGVPTTNEEWVTFANDGHRELLETTKTPVIDATGKLIGVLGISHDITQRKQAERYERFRSATLELLASETPLPVILESIVRGVEHLHPDMMCSILLLDKEGKCFAQSIAPSVPAAYNNAILGVEIGLGVGSCGTAAYTGERVIVEEIATHPYWTPFAKLAADSGLGASWSEPILTSSRQVLGTFAIYHRQRHTPTEADIYIIEQSARLASIAIGHKKMEEKVQYVAFHDALTGLPNRLLLNDRIEQAKAASRRNGRYAALLFLDMDNFKPLNDQYGHDAGDLLLREVARRLSRCVREVDTVARFGGDEFAVVLRELDEEPADSASQAAAVAEKIRTALALPYVITIQGEASGEVAAKTTVEHHCTSSIGVVLFNHKNRSDADIVKWADSAMYQAKAAGRNRVQFYEPAS